MRTLALVTDAFGGSGGIGQYNRHFLTALCQNPECEEVVALPRLVFRQEEPLPTRLTWLRQGLGGKLRYFLALIRLLATDRRYDIIYCAHINLLPAAALARWLTGGRLILQIHGIDAWQPTRSALTNYLAARVDLCLAVSRITRRRFLSWANLSPEKCRVLPNTIPDGVFSPGPKNPELVERYGLQGKKVLMTLGRMSKAEAYKGFDEVLSSLPALKKDFPNIVYLIVGDGDDRARLQERARQVGVVDRVVFTGAIPEQEKACHYRLADLFLMQSAGEGFGIVLIEALACGLPVIASSIDGCRDAMRDGRYGVLVHPCDSDGLVASVRMVFAKGAVRCSPLAFSYGNFMGAVSRMVVALPESGE